MIKLLTLLLFIFLTGCTLLQQAPEPIPPAISWKAHAAAVNQVNSWTTSGSISIQHDNETNLASLTWEQQPQHYHFALFGPLGFGRVTIEGGPTSLTLTQSNQPPVSAATPELLMQQQLGWRIPVSHLYYWARGLPAPGIPAKKTFDASNRLSTLQQAGWKIDYSEYMEVDQVVLPKKIQLVTDRLKIKWVVKNWEVEK